MKITTLLLFISFITLRLAAQQDKPPIDTGMLIRQDWPYILPSENDVAISRNGRYAAYIVYNQVDHRKTLTIQDLRGNWKKRIISPNARILFFTADNKHLCWQQNDSIWLQQTGRDRGRLLGVTPTVSYPSNTNGKWIILSHSEDTSLHLFDLVNGNEQTFTDIRTHSWLRGGRKLFLYTSSRDVKLFDLFAGKEQLYSGVMDHILSPDEKSMVLLTGEGNTRSLQYVNEESGVSITIWTGNRCELPKDFIYDPAGKQFAFCVQAPDGKVMTIWCYKMGQPAAVLEMEDKITGLTGDLQVSGIRAFSDNGRWLFLTIKKQLSQVSGQAVTTQVDIWSYRDEILNPAQSVEMPTFYDYTAVLELGSTRIQLLEKHDDERAGNTFEDYVVLETRVNKAGAWWPHNGERSYWLVSLTDGKRKLIGQYAPSLSPGGRWIYYWDPQLEHFFILDPQTVKTINLTSDLPVTVADEIEQWVQAIPAGMAGWYADDSAVLVYDNYDIWKLDPSGRAAPVNITGGYGRQNGIKLRFVYMKDIYKGDEKLLLSGYDVEKKYNGFFTIHLNKAGSLQKLTMGPYNYYQTTIFHQSFNNPLQPLMGGEGKNKRWIVMRQSAMEYPNFFVSKDLKEFAPITNLQPQKNCNWLTSEAVSWKMYNGQLNTGVLYKPENFDSTKKYPIIFNYYEKSSHRCYQFPMPELTKHNINIPWFVSRGYLVFTPDIQYSTAARPGGMTISEAAYNAVASAAEYLSQRSYVDKNRMGIQGHSFGGHETNGIITYTNLFAAAAEVAGYSDPVSAYLTLATGVEGGSIEKEHKIDHFNQRMGATPWERPDLFRRNSPVQNADKVTTPLMIVHNKKDGSVNFHQGMEMYMALRRLGKPCWLLQYDNSGHILKGNDALDYTIRLTQYFDHYLKGAPAPQWMTMNTLAEYKGKNNLYALDPGGNCMKDCKVCAEWNAKEK